MSWRRKQSIPRKFVAEPEREPQPVPEKKAPVPRLRHFPDEDHLPEDYSDLVDASEIPDYMPRSIYEDMERHLPAALRAAPRAEKLAIMQRILAGNVPSPEKFAVMKSYRQYRQMICSKYKPLHPQLYRMNPEAFFLPSFLRAIRQNTIQSIYDMIQEPIPKVYTFPMLRPSFCEMLINEVEYFQNWARREKQKIYDPNDFDKSGSGTTISDIGMKRMLDDLMKLFISPISKVLFPEVGGGYLDSQHSNVVSYSGKGIGDDMGLGMHVEDAAITLNICLGKKFTGGEMYFFGRRCEKHYNSGPHEQEASRYSQLVGQALLYHGRHRHCVNPSFGFRANMIMCCRSSLFKEMRECKIDFPDWCSRCLHENIASRKNIPIP